LDPTYSIEKEEKNKTLHQCKKNSYYFISGGNKAGTLS